MKDASGIFSRSSLALADALKSSVPQNIMGFHERANEYARTIRPVIDERPRCSSVAEAWGWIRKNARSHQRVRVYRGEPYGRHLAEVKIDGVTYVYHATKGWKKGVHS